MSRVVDLTGKRFGRLIVSDRAESGATGAARWNARCDCGADVQVFGSNLRRGTTTSCGCARRDNGRAHPPIARQPHGHARRGERTSTYEIWKSMRQRCFNPRSKGWTDYGGRGITVCDRWSSFEAFLADMGERPEGLSIDRIDNDGNYEPGNCRWATASEQALNRRRSRVAEVVS